MFGALGVCRPVAGLHSVTESDGGLANRDLCRSDVRQVVAGWMDVLCGVFGWFMDEIVIVVAIFGVAVDCYPAERFLRTGCGRRLPNNGGLVLIVLFPWTDIQRSLCGR